MIMKQPMEFMSAILLLFVTLSAVMAEEDNIGGDTSLAESCEHENFYCNYDDPSVFYRCLKDTFHTFHCPSGLHFSVGTQTCDWPHKADCSGGEMRPEASNDHQGDGGSVEDGAQTHSVESHDQDMAKELNEAKESSWINQAAAAGKSWWRPEGLKPQQWQDAHSVQKPVFKPHTPDEPKLDSESTTEETIETTIPVTSAPKTSGPESAHSASANREESSKVQWKEGSCSSSCKLPTCHCVSNTVPNGFPVSSVPQMVMVTFDDEVSAAFYGYFQRLFRPGRYNPNGCPIRGCLFVSGSGTDYNLVHPLYSMGVEIASHTVSHRFPHTWWSSASYQEYVDEASGMRDNLINMAGIPKEAIKGFRVPFLQLGSDNMYSALYDSKFVYDTSMFTGSEWESDKPIWPFTLDYVPNNTICQHGPCPKKQYPGMWEIPVQRWYGLDGHSCAMPDACSSTGDAEETLEYLKSNFRRFYGVNRAPFGIFVHARWFNSEHNLDGLDRFIDYLLRLDDVYFVTPSQVIEWMKHPVPLSEINGFGPWTCQGAAKDVWVDQGK